MLILESNPELVLRAISELHKIEMSLHTLMKELPGDIKTSEDFHEKDKVKEKNGIMTFDEWVTGNNNLRPRIGDDSSYNDEDNGHITGDCIRNTRSILRTGRIKTPVLILMRSGILNQIHQKLLERIPSKAIVNLRLILH